MNPTRKQISTVNDFMKSNPSAVWDNTFSFYSNGQCIIDFYWVFDNQKIIYKLKVNPDGRLKNN